MTSSLTIVQISDCHLFADANKSGYQNIKPYFSLQRVLQLVVRHKPHLVLVTGDISGDYSQASYEHFWFLWQQACIDAQLQLLPGNHDCLETMQQVFPKEHLWHQALDHQFWQIHLLNTKGKGTSGHLAPEQLSELEHKVSASDKHQLLAMHHHPLDCNSWMDKHAWQNKQQFCDWAQGQQQIKAMLYGHIHTDKHQNLAHIDTWACPSTCWQWQTSKEFAVSDEAPGYRLLNLLADGSIQTQVYRLGGEG